MTITVELLSNELSKYKLKCFIHNKNLVINSVMLLNSSQIKFEPNIIYLGTQENMSFYLADDSTINLVILTQDLSLDPYLGYKNLNVILINENIQLSDMLNTIQKILLKQDKYSNTSAKLTDLFFDGCDLQQLIECAFEALENPICLSDSTYNLIAYTPDHDLQDDPAWNEITQKKYIPEHYIDPIRNCRIVEQVGKEVLVTDIPFSIYKNIWTHIKINKKTFAHLAVINYMRDFNQEDIDFTNFLSKVILSYLEKCKSAKNSKKFMYENFITDLLTAKINDDASVEENRKHFNICSNMQVLLISISPYDLLNTNIPYCREQIENLLGMNNSIIFSDYIIFIIDEDKDLFRNKIIQLKKYLKKNKMKAGISYSFNKLKNLSKYYQQTLTAIELGTSINSQELIYRYENYTIYQLIKNSKLKEELIDYCHPSIYKLMDYDRKSGTTFADTLYVYLENSKNITLSAKLLNIHRNSLNYRIEKIFDIMELSQNNRMVMFSLQLSFHILRYLGYFTIKYDV